MTKDERLLLEIYKETLAGGKVVNPLKIAQRLGFKEKLTQNILRGLMQANFLKRYTPEEFSLTPGGVEMARSLLKE